MGHIAKPSFGPPHSTTNKFIFIYVHSLLHYTVAHFPLHHPPIGCWLPGNGNNQWLSTNHSNGQLSWPLCHCAVGDVILLPSGPDSDSRPMLVTSPFWTVYYMHTHATHKHTHTHRCSEQASKHPPRGYIKHSSDDR